jgi:two-component system response regulator YesN
MEIENLFRSVSVGDTKNMRESVEKIYEYPGNTLPLMYRDYSFSITFLILLRICQLQNKYDVSEAIVSQKLLELKNLRKEYPTVEEQKKLVANSACKLSNLIASQEVGTPSKIILSALDYINIHFSENISLSDVADNINLSKNYLCDLFKKELGVTFINYVTNLRIEKAKEYLVSTDMKMYEVSDAVGYSDYAYFSQIFKKHTGITLSAYRRQN